MSGTPIAGIASTWMAIRGAIAPCGTLLATRSGPSRRSLGIARASRPSFVWNARALRLRRALQPVDNRGPLRPVGRPLDQHELAVALVEGVQRGVQAARVSVRRRRHRLRGGELEGKRCEYHRADAMPLLNGGSCLANGALSVVSRATPGVLEEAYARPRRVMPAA